MRLIDSDALLAKLRQCWNDIIRVYGIDDDYACGFDDAITYVDDAPTATEFVPPLVKCKNCQYAKNVTDRYALCTAHPTFLHYVPADGYCHRAKRDGGAE